MLSRLWAAAALVPPPPSPPRKNFWPDPQTEAAMFLLTLATKAAVVNRKRQGAQAVLRTIGLTSKATVAIQRTWRRRRLATPREAAPLALPPPSHRGSKEAKEQSSSSTKTSLLERAQARARSVLTRRRAAVECACLERQLAADALRLWRASATPLSTRAKIWHDVFVAPPLSRDDVSQKTSRFVRLARARRVIVGLAESPVDAADADAAERKALYLALERNQPGLDLRQTYRRFGLDHLRKQKKRRLIAAFFSTTDLAPASADVVKALFCCCAPPPDVVTTRISLARRDDDDDLVDYRPSTFAGDVLLWHRHRGDDSADVDLRRLTLAGRIVATSPSLQGRSRLFPSSSW